MQFSNLVTGEFPPEVSLMKSTLQILDVGNNPVYSNGSALWPFLGQMTQLTDLRTDRTNFATINGIPTQLANLQKLRYFLGESSLYKGPLSGSAFPTGLSVLSKSAVPRYAGSIKYNSHHSVAAILDIEGNDFSGSTIPFEIGLLPSLENFYIRASNVTGNLNYMTNMKNVGRCYPLVLRRYPTNAMFTFSREKHIYPPDASTVETFVDNNPGLTGTIPTELGQLTNLGKWLVHAIRKQSQQSNTHDSTLLTSKMSLPFSASFSTTECSFTGTLPSELGNLGTSVRKYSK